MPPATAAEGEVKASIEPAVAEQAVFGVRYGPVFKQGRQGPSDFNNGASFEGLTHDVGVYGVYFGEGHFGLRLGAQREASQLQDSAGQKQSVSLFRAELGPAARVSLGPVRLEGLVGYGLAQLPAMTLSGEPTFAPATRHAVLVAARTRLALPWESYLGVRGELPVPVQVTDASGGKAASSGFAAGASLGKQVAEVGQLGFGVLADYQFVSDRLTASDRKTTASQSVSRVGLAVEMAWLAPPQEPPPAPGALLVLVSDADTGRPVESAAVTLEANGVTSNLSTSRDGRVEVSKVALGPVLATVSAGGFLRGEAFGTVVSGRQARLEVRLKKVPPKVGGLNLALLDKKSGQPVANARVKVGDAEYIANAAGTLVLVELPLGPTPVTVAAQGYVAADEVVQVIAGKSSDVEIALVRQEQKVLANITGKVRNVRGGGPVPALLEIPEVKIRKQASRDGTFAFNLPGGTYNVVITAPGFIPQTKAVSVKDGDQAIFNVDLHPKGR